MANYEGGYTSAVNSASTRDQQAASAMHLMALVRAAALAEQAKQRERAAGGTAFTALAETMGGAIAPPPPGVQGGGPQAPMPGTDSRLQVAPPPVQASAPAPAPPQAAPQQALPPPLSAGGQMAAPPVARPIPPFRPLPSAPAAAAPAAQDGIPPPPALPAPAMAAPAAAAPERQVVNLPTIIQALNKGQGTPEEKMEALNALRPVLNEQQTQELKLFQAQTSALKAANEAYRKEMDLLLREQAEDRRRDQGDRRIDVLQQNADTRASDSERRLRRSIENAVGGAGNLKQVEFIYPKKEDGTIDQTKEPIGTRGVTKTGRMVVLDTDGVQTTIGALGGLTPKEGKATNVAVKDVVRSSLVKGSAINALRLLDEVEKEHPNATTSAFFGTHATNPVSKLAHAGGKAALLTQKDRQIDAKWAGIIEEVGPVLSGGLRNSDAFRRFLIDQAPTMMDNPATVKEKIKILRDNVDGTSSAFFDKFSRDPKMWGEGVTKDQVAAAKGGGARAPAAGALPRGIPAGSTLIGKTPDGKDVYKARDGKQYVPD